ncbi:hypothetical protein [Sulfuricurvum sp.]|uniref:hypothetical protein n=1 Tax=Sulfuricurvum sp. TaxID=2025608 RepID=UPI00286E1C3F|nr:hypothetical protein [Sulfuricurvum sp.]
MESNVHIDLKSMILNKIKEDDFETYSKIIRIKEITKIDKTIKDQYSISFLLDLFFAFENGSLNIEAVMYEIRFLEGLEETSRTKDSSQFRRPPLKGLWHKHYFDGSISALAQNVKNALDNYGMPYFESMVDEAKTSGEERFITAEDIPHIVNDVVTSNFQRRQADQKTTGEWLIYAIHENVNYFLCLAKHGEGDEQIRTRIDSTCVHEFPFLKSILV